MDFTPLHDRVLLLRDEADEKVGQIFIPENSRDKMTTAVVVAVGSGRRNKTTNEVIPLAVQEGDRVMIGRHSGTEIKLNKVEHVIVREDEILGTIGT